MIVEYEDDGHIVHIISDPVPHHMAAFLRENGRQFIDLLPIPWPPEPQIDPLTGGPLLDEEQNQVWASNGVDYVRCDILGDYVVDGILTPRPACPATVSMTRRTISISDVPAGSIVEIALEGVSIQIDGDDQIEIDEAGPATVTITPPWPFLEASHDLEIE